MNQMGVQDIKDVLAEAHEDAQLADGFDDALIGLAERHGFGPVAAYDRNHCINMLTKQGMTTKEAEEHFEYNVIGSWVGDGTPVFVTVLRAV